MQSYNKVSKSPNISLLFCSQHIIEHLHLSPPFIFHPKRNNSNPDRCLDRNADALFARAITTRKTAFYYHYYHLHTQRLELQSIKATKSLSLTITTLSLTITAPSQVILRKTLPDPPVIREGEDVGRKLERSAPERCVFEISAKGAT